MQIEAVENHMPEVVIVDEIGTNEEALACRSIAERGVQLVGTAHGQVLENLLKNPAMTDLIGGIQTVTLGAAPCSLRQPDLPAHQDSSSSHYSCLAHLCNGHPGASLLPVCAEARQGRPQMCRAQACPEQDPCNCCLACFGPQRCVTALSTPGMDAQQLPGPATAANTPF